MFMRGERPTFLTARLHFQRLLLMRGWSPELVWVAREVLALDYDDDGLRANGVDPQIDEAAVAMVYRLLVRERRPIIFECLGHHPKFTVVTLQGDDRSTGLLNARFEVEWGVWYNLDCPYWPALDLNPARTWDKRKQP
jgi:hypothetical protein